MKRLTVLLASATLAACQTTPPEEEPAYLKATAVESRVAAVEGRAQSVEGRVAVVERQAQSLLELQRQLDRQSAELRSLRGELEQLQEAARKSGDEQRNLHEDVDRRLAVLESATPAPSAPSPATVAVDDEADYQTALSRLRAKDYRGATTALKDFPERHPASPLRDAARYWLGEIHLVEGRHAEALEVFQSLVREFPESKRVPDALLKAGSCQVELRQWTGARKTFRRIVQEFPGTPAAKEAAARLATFDGSKGR
ncbi:MAG: tol-pal system protein YbgF [Gammaproteobacteria bacterium]